MGKLFKPSGCSGSARLLYKQRMFSQPDPLHVSQIIGTQLWLLSVVFCLQVKHFDGKLREYNSLLNLDSCLSTTSLLKLTGFYRMINLVTLTIPRFLSDDKSSDTYDPYLPMRLMKYWTEDLDESLRMSFNDTCLYDSSQVV